MFKVQQPQGLISVLLNKNAEFGDRDDAAIDLSGYDEPEAELALIEIGSNENEDEDLLDTCGGSIGEIWSRKRQVKQEVLKHLKGRALESAIAMIRARKPELLNDQK